MTIRASKIFIDGSDLPLFSVQVTREVTASKGSYNEFANFSSESGKYYIFITVLKNGSIKPSHFVVNFDHSLSLANGSYNYYKLCQVEGATELDADLEILLDATGGKLRLHRTSAGVGNTYDITIQNLADDSLAMTKPNIKGTDSWYPEAEGYIIYSASVPEKVDHRALSNVGKYTHQQIDSYIDNPKAPLTHTHNYQDINDFIDIVNGLIDAHGGGGSSIDVSYFTDDEVDGIVEDAFDSSEPPVVPLMESEINNITEDAFDGTSPTPAGYGWVEDIVDEVYNPE